MIMRSLAVRAVPAVLVILTARPQPVRVAAQQKSPSPSGQARGEAIFLGQEATIGRLEGDSAALPAELSRCANCHGAGRPDQNLRLDRSTLLALKKRRGAPPSAYTRDAFCRVVRTGVDPAFVVLGREMPRYALDEAQCSSLWSYLTYRGEPSAR